MKNKRLGLLATAVLAGLPGLASAAGPSVDEILTNTGLTATGHLSASYTGGFNKGQLLAYRAFDTDANSFEFNQAALTVSKLPASGFGGLVTVTVGSDAKVINGSYGSGGGDFALTQGYLQYATGNLTVIGGRYVTLAGAEVIDDSADSNLSRSLLFTLAEPLVHTGVRASYALGNTTLYLGLANSAVSGAALDTDKTKTVETGASYASADKKLGLGAYDYYGVDGGTKTNFLDLVVSYQLTDRLQLVGNGDYARFVGNGVDVYAYGFAGYLNYQFTAAWKGSLRGEYLKTKNLTPGADSAGKSDLEEITATVGYSPVKNVTLLGELRYDFSGDKNFPDPCAGFPACTAPGDSLSKSQGNVGLKAIYTFGNAS
jgi:hypothetical protein